MSVVWATTIQITHPWDSAILREHLATMCYTIFHKRDIYQQANGICNNCKLVYILHLEFTYVSVPHQSGSVSSSRSLIAFKESLKRLGLRLRQEPTLRDSQNWLTSTLNTWERCQIKIPTNERNYWVTKKSCILKGLIIKINDHGPVSTCAMIVAQPASNS